ETAPRSLRPNKSKRKASTKLTLGCLHEIGFNKVAYGFPRQHEFASCPYAVNFSANGSPQRSPACHRTTNSSQGMGQLRSVQPMASAAEGTRVPTMRHHLVRSFCRADFKSPSASDRPLSSN